MPFLKKASWLRNGETSYSDDQLNTSSVEESLDDEPPDFGPKVPQSVPLRMLGFGILMGWHFLILYFPELSLEASPDLSERFIGQFVLNGSVCLSFLFFGWLIGRHEERMSSLMNKMCFASTAVTVVAVLVFGFVKPNTLPVLYHGSIGVMGFCEGLFMLLWFRFYAESSTNYTVSYLAASAIVGALICYFARNLTGYLPLVVFIALPIFSMILFLSAVRNTTHREASLHGKGRNNWSGASGFFYKTTAQLVAFSFCFGLLQGIATLGDSIPFRVDNSLSTLGFGVAGGILYIVYLRSPKHQDLMPAHLISVVLFLLGISFVPFVEGWPSVAMSALAMTGFTLFDMATLSFLINLTRSFDLNAESTLGYNRAAEYGAFTLGIALSFLVVQLFGDYPLLANLVTTASAFVCAVTVLLLFLDTDNIWTSENAQNIGGFGAEDDAITEMKGRWKTACEQICDEYQLSPREKDVFALIAKGRNAEYVQNALYISGHTAKTHISNIYKKLEIHSVQELLDMVEERKGSLN